MNRKTFRLFYYSFIVLFTYFIIAAPVSAATWGSCVQDVDVATLQCLVPMVERVIQGVLALAGVALFVMLVVGGYNFLLSGGDQKKLETAKGTITGAILGLVVMVVAFLIIKTIATFTGVGSVTNFTIPQWK
ncbi:MAG: hypothetical protein Q8L37_04230 [Candidatus Gottesmanbacteria bacterium]|nr:hypothetical protein [Candidatus Gottesmanbacteria bacterium]